jgi:small subunit ribosomal protein S5
VLIIKLDDKISDLKDKVVFVNRVTKVVKGGRNFRFAALVAVGDKNGRIGIGSGKAAEVVDAVNKARGRAKKNIIFVNLNSNYSIYHEVLGKFGSAKVIMKPAANGKGLIAGGAVRIILELVGIRNIRAKSIGSSNKHNVVNAAMDALRKIMTPRSVSIARGKTIEEILGKYSEN